MVFVGLSFVQILGIWKIISFPKSNEAKKIIFKSIIVLYFHVKFRLVIYRMLIIMKIWKQLSEEVREIVVEFFNNCFWLYSLTITFVQTLRNFLFLFPQKNRARIILQFFWLVQILLYNLFTKIWPVYRLWDFANTWVCHSRSCIEVRWKNWCNPWQTLLFVKKPL